MPPVGRFVVSGVLTYPGLSDSTSIYGCSRYKTRVKKSMNALVEEYTGSNGYGHWQSTLLKLITAPQLLGVSTIRVRNSFVKSTTGHMLVAWDFFKSKGVCSGKLVRIAIPTLFTKILTLISRSWANIFS